MSIIAAYRIRCTGCRTWLIDMGAHRAQRRFRETHVGTEATEYDTWSGARRAARLAGWLQPDEHSSRGAHCETCREATARGI